MRDVRAQLYRMRYALPSTGAGPIARAGHGRRPCPAGANHMSQSLSPGGKLGQKLADVLDRVVSGLLQPFRPAPVPVPVPVRRRGTVSGPYSRR